MKKIICVLLTICLSLVLGSSRTFVHGGSACDADPGSSECKQERLREHEQRMNELDQKIAEAKQNKAEAQALATEFAEKTETLNKEIEILLPQIEALQARIDDLTERIETNEALVAELNRRVLSRMEKSQGTMHFNPFLDFLLGSDGFDDLMRRTYGLEAITEREGADRQNLIDTINQLNSDKAELADTKAELDIQMDELETKRKEAERMAAYYTEMVAETDAEIDQYRNEYDESKKIVMSIEWNMDELGEMPARYSFSSPVPGASVSAGVWHYPASFGGGVHLGIDYAVGLGSNIYAPADGVIIVSDDNCPTRGYLGNSCGGAGGGVSYGGNQLYMLCSVDGDVYGITFSHLYSGSVHSKGVVTRGTVIGRVGSSGNSTGAHCHIELYYLGQGDNEDLVDYVNLVSRGYYSSSFNCGWGTYALNRLCQNGVGAPCRLDGRMYFGG